MKCSKQPCICHANHYKLLFKGFGLLYLYGVQCKMCLKQYPGIVYMFSLIILINFFIYPLLFKMKIIVIDRKKE